MKALRILTGAARRGATPTSEASGIWQRAALSAAPREAAMKQFMTCCVAALALAAGTLAVAQAQPSAAASVTPPARADVALRGSVLARRNVAESSGLPERVSRHAGLHRLQLQSCRQSQLQPARRRLTDLAVKGAVSCRMPCEAGPVKVAPPQRLATPGLPTRQLPAAADAGAGTASTQSASFGTGSGPEHTTAPLRAGSRSVAGSCGGGAVAATPAATPTTVTLTPINDNTIASSGLSSVYENSVYQSNYWSATAPGIGAGCDQLYVALSGNQYLSCARGLGIKFNLASLAGKTIQSATLKLTTSASGVGSYKDQWYVAAGASAWSGSTVTWVNYGGLTGACRAG